MSSLTFLDATFIGTILEGLFYGLYCVIFILYFRVHTSKKTMQRDHLIYPLSMLFVLCTSYFLVDFIQQFLTILRGQKGQPLVGRLNITASAMYSFTDFISQGILIYRCWVVWSNNLLVVVIPSILSLTSLATSLTLVAELRSLGETGRFNDPPAWFTPVGISSFSLSLAVNAILTGLLVAKIAKASLAARYSVSRNARGISDLRSLMTMLIESGIVLFAAQLVWVVFFALQHNAFYLVGGSVTMLYGIVPTLIVVRVAVGPYSNSNRQSLSVESGMRFAIADEHSATKISGNIFQWESRLSSTYPSTSQDSRETVTEGLQYEK